jgi:hypothetical protein
MLNPSFIKFNSFITNIIDEDSSLSEFSDVSEEKDDNEDILNADITDSMKQTNVLIE